MIGEGQGQARFEQGGLWCARLGARPARRHTTQVTHELCTCNGPPGRSTLAERSVLPSRTPATTTAHAPVPHASVRPAPLSHTDIRTCSLLSTCGVKDDSSYKCRCVHVPVLDTCIMCCTVMAGDRDLPRLTAGCGQCKCLGHLVFWPGVYMENCPHHFGPCPPSGQCLPHLDELCVGPRWKHVVRLELRADAEDVQLVNLRMQDQPLATNPAVAGVPPRSFISCRPL